MIKNDFFFFWSATDEIVQNLTNNLDYLIPDFVRARNTAAKVTSLADEVYQFYMNSTQPSYSNLRDYINVSSMQSLWPQHILPIPSLFLCRFFVWNISLNEPIPL